MKSKNIIIGILSFSLLCIFSGYSAGSFEITKTKTVKIKCEEMTCAGCQKKITKSINNLDGVKEIDVNLDTKIITVSFDESKTDTGKIIDAIAKAGYESVLIE